MSPCTGVNQLLLLQLYARQLLLMMIEQINCLIFTNSATRHPLSRVAYSLQPFPVVPYTKLFFTGNQGQILFNETICSGLVYSCLTD